MSSGLLQLTAGRHGLFRRLQSVQNAAARLVTVARRCDHITPVLRQLQWLPVRQRVVFKITWLIHQSLVGAAPVYLAVAFCRTLVVVHCGPIPMTRASCWCREHIINLVIGVSRPLVLDCGTNQRQHSLNSSSFKSQKTYYHYTWTNYLEQYTNRHP